MHNNLTVIVTVIATVSITFRLLKLVATVGSAIDGIQRFRRIRREDPNYVTYR